MNKKIQKELLSIMKEVIKLEINKNGTGVSSYCPVILHQPKRPKIHK